MPRVIRLDLQSLETLIGVLNVVRVVVGLFSVIGKREGNCLYYHEQVQLLQFLSGLPVATVNDHPAGRLNSPF